MLILFRALSALIFFLCISGCNETQPADSRGLSIIDSPGKADYASPLDEDWGEDLNDPPAVEESAYILTLDLPESCASPCQLRAELSPSSSNTRVEFEADGWYLGHTFGSPAVLVYDFTQAGMRSIKATAYEGDEIIAQNVQSMFVTLPKDTCSSYESVTPESAPIQVTGGGAPDGALALNWVNPAEAIFYAPFSGTPGKTAIHEGIDYIHGDDTSPYIPVYAAADGEVAYVRTGCAQSSLFISNAENRECGSGWGNHVVLDHGNGIHTRYAHISPGTLEVIVGQQVLAGDLLGEMGNSGRSETRHLHFELGVSSQGFDPCTPAQSLDTVYDPASVGL